MHRPVRRLPGRAGAAVAAVVLGSGMLTGCLPDTGQSVAGQGYIAGQGTIAEVAAADRDDPVTLSGRTFSVAAAGGTVDIGVTIGPGCSWRTQGLPDWVQTDLTSLRALRLDGPPGRFANGEPSISTG